LPALVSRACDSRGGTIAAMDSPQDPTPELTVRRCTPGDAAVLRTLRLAMLDDAPEAFDVDRDDVTSHPQQWWVDWARAAAEGSDRVVYLAVDDAGDAFAMIAAHRDGDVVHTGALWVDPRRRGRGVAAALLDTVCTWAGGTGATGVELGVSEANPRAAALYRSLGFAPTGAAHRTRWGTAEIIMARPVT
jgi:GNAT superfamily N-acetyltransferase